MPRARNPLIFPAIEQLDLLLGANDATEQELLGNQALFDAYYTIRREAKRPASTETLHKDRMQWGALCKWFASERIRAEAATEATFNAFFASPERRDNHIRNHMSYLRLYNRVMYANALAARRAERWSDGESPAANPFEEDVDRNDAKTIGANESLGTGLQWNRVAEKMMASDRFRFADMAENKRPPVFLSPADDRRLRDHLFQIPKQGSFASLRTFVLMAVIRGSGASPGEIRTLQLDEIDRDAAGRPIRLRMYGRSGNQGHVYALEDFAQRALHYWLAFNLSSNLPERVVRGFPEVQHATEAKRARFVFPNLHLKDARYGQPIDGDTATRAVREALHKLGLRVEGSITQMLRTQYATTALLDGNTPADVVEKMGYYDTRSVKGFVAIARGEHGTGVRL